MSQRVNLELNAGLIKKVASDWKITPATFAHRISRGSWIPAPHLMYISSRIARAVAKGNARIIISAPPRHGKSQLSSIYLPSWVLERFPEKKVILTGYGADLVTGFSRQVRDLFLEPDNQHLLTTRIRKDASRVEAFITEQGGGMYAVGLGGAITGRGAHVLLIDDYIKEIKEALSPTYREYMWNWFSTTAFTRLEPGGSCIIIATRWHSDDLIGRILKNFPGQWEYIEIPAIAEENDLLGREVGDALFPERYPLPALQELKTTLGTIFFQALYQQKPVDESKKMTDSSWFHEIDAIPPEEHQYLKSMRMWDLAATEDGGDYTCGSLVSYSIKTGNTYVQNIIRDQMSSQDVEVKVETTAIADGKNISVGIEQEPGSAGKSLVNHYAVQVLPGFVVKPIPAVNKKLIRAQPFLAAAEAGKVYLIKGSWNKDFKTEFDSFPGGANDDQVDTVSAAYLELSGKKLFSASWGRPNRGRTANSTAIKQAMAKNSSFEKKKPSIVFGRR